MSTIDHLPVDLLVDSLLPAFSPRDLISLSRTCRRWHTFLTERGNDSEVMWMRRSIREFNFPVRASGRRSGWFEVYSKLSRSAAYIWGQNDNGRLALSDGTHSLPTSLRSRLIEGGLVLPTRLELPAPPVSIVAGGWSFHALTAEGNVISWGTLDGGSWARDDAPLSDAGRTVRPMVLPYMKDIGAISQLDAGRGHVLMLGQDGKVWEMRSLGRAVEVRDEARRWGHGSSTEASIVSVHAGWDYSTVLTSDGNAFVWWEPGSAPLDRAAEAAGEATLTSPSTQGVTFPLDIDTLQLPSLDSTDDKIVLLACGDNFVIALTDASKMYFLDLSPVADPQHPHAPQGSRGDAEDSPTRSRASRARLENEFLSGRRKWRLMKKFCDMDEVSKLEGFKEKAISKDTKITHVSAHFNTFAAYSVPSSSDTSQSLALLGNGDWHEHSVPEVIPELQGIGVIKIAQGDYHNLALTSSGQLYSWGAFSGGSLGLGHPQLSNTPLSAPHPMPAPQTGTETEQGVRPHPMPRTVNNPNRPLPAPTRQPHPIFPGFVPARPANIPPRAPQRVDKPTRVRFFGDQNDDGNEIKSNTFVYAVTASGWHSGALAVDLSSSSSGGAKTSEGDSEPIIRLSSHQTEEVAMDTSEGGEQRVEPVTRGSWMGRMGRGIRIGHAGRGVNRGGAGGSVRPPSR